MNNSNPSLITLQQASLCLDCEMLTAAHKNCLACVSPRPLECCQSFK